MEDGFHRHDLIKLMQAARLLVPHDNLEGPREQHKLVRYCAKVGWADNDSRTSGRQSTFGTNDTVDIERGMSRLKVSTPGASGNVNSSEGRPASNQRPPGHAFTATERDARTGLQTTWEVGASVQYTDPAGTAQRTINLKRIREGSGKKDPATTSSTL